MSDIGVPTLRQLGATDAEAFSTLRREVTADNPVPMGLALEEELTRPLQGFREQLSYPEPNAAFGVLVGTELVGSTAVGVAKQVSIVSAQGHSLGHVCLSAVPAPRLCSNARH